jgi:hypothetical protein
LGNCVQDRIAGGIVDRDAQMQNVSAGCCILGAAYCLREAVGKTIAASNHTETNAVADQACNLLAEIAPQQSHQRGHLCPRPAPVVARERVKRERPDALPRRRFNDAPDGFDAGFVPALSGQTLSGRPTSIAVHDDADMKFG